MVATLTSKGQITLPKQIREQLDLHSGDRLDFVLCETAWVLSRAYGYTREQIAIVLRQILLTDSFDVEDHALAWDALYDYQGTKADYADCLMMRVNHRRGASATFTFDKGAGKLSGFTLLTKEI